MQIPSRPNPHLHSNFTVGLTFMDLVLPSNHKRRLDERASIGTKELK